MIEIILKKHIEKLGFIGDVVKVKGGFARFLLRCGDALRATKANIEVVAKEKARLEAENIKRRDEAQKIASRMAKIKLDLVRPASESGKLYGAITVREIVEEVGNVGFTISPKQILLDQGIKHVGTGFSIKVRLHEDVTIAIPLTVKAAGDSAEDALEVDTPVAQNSKAEEQEKQKPKTKE